MNRGFNLVINRLTQGMKEQASKCGDSTLRSVKDSASPSSSSSSSASSSSARKFSGALDSTGFKAAASERLRQAEDSLRTVMYLSCWGPN